MSYLSPQDNIYLSMFSRESKQPIICARIDVDGELSVDELKAHCCSSLLRHAQFTSIPTWTRAPITGHRLGLAQWVADDDFDIDRHVAKVLLPTRAGEAEICSFVSRRAMEPLREDRPLWDASILHFDGDHSRSTVIFRVHHCVGDGTSLVKLLFSLTEDNDNNNDDAENDNEDDDDCTRKRRRWNDDASSSSDDDEDDHNSICCDSDDTSEHSDRSSSSDDEQERECDEQEQRRQNDDEKDEKDEKDDAPKSNGFVRCVWFLIVFAIHFCRHLAMVFYAFQPFTSTRMRDTGLFKAPAGTSSKMLLVKSAPINMSDMRFLSDALGVTLNDIYLACCAGALRRYIVERHGDDALKILDNSVVRAMVPFKRRTLCQTLSCGLTAWIRRRARSRCHRSSAAATAVSVAPSPNTLVELGNDISSILLRLPVHHDDVFERVRSVARRTHSIKVGAEPLINALLQHVIALSPWLTRRVVHVCGECMSLIATNVCGPASRRIWCGHAITDVSFWLPFANFAFTMISYDDSMSVGIACDPRIVPDPHRLATLFYDDFQALLHDSRATLENASLFSGCEARLRRNSSTDIFIL
jgi:WS/DGAT C-terminal domain/Wax ester synthase/diacylglycerol acyltransferase catalytic domain